MRPPGVVSEGSGWQDILVNSIILVTGMGILLVLLCIRSKVSRSLSSIHDQLWSRLLQVVRLTDPCHGIDEDLGQVQLVPELRGRVVPGKGVMEVVPSCVFECQ